MLKVFLVVSAIVGGNLQHGQPHQMPSLEVCLRQAAKIIQATGVPDGAQAFGVSCFVSEMSAASGDSEPAK